MNVLLEIRPDAAKNETSMNVLEQDDLLRVHIWPRRRWYHRWVRLTKPLATVEVKAIAFNVQGDIQ